MRQTASIFVKQEEAPAINWRRTWVIERAGTIFGYASDNELGWLYDTATSLGEGAIWVEVGSLCGRSFLAAGLALPLNSTLIAVDCLLGLQKRGGQTLLSTYEELVSERPDLQIVLIKADSLVAADHVPVHSCDVVYIDASHDKASITRDIDVWSMRVKQGALLCGHDYANPLYPDIKVTVDQLPGASVAIDYIWQCRL